MMEKKPWPLYNGGFLRESRPFVMESRANITTKMNRKGVLRFAIYY